MLFVLHELIRGMPRRAAVNTNMVKLAYSSVTTHNKLFGKSKRLAMYPTAGSTCIACIAKKCAGRKSPTSIDQPMIGIRGPLTEGLPM